MPIKSVLNLRKRSDKIELKISINGLFSGYIIPVSTLSLGQYNERIDDYDQIMVFVFSKDDTKALLKEQELEICFESELEPFKPDECNLVTPPVGTNNSFLIINLTNNHVKLTNNRADIVHLTDKIKAYWW